MISESDILKCFQHLVDKTYHEDSILLGSGDDAAVIDTQGRQLVHSVDISKTGVNLLLGGDCGCLLNISGVMKHSGNKTTLARRIVENL